MKLKLSFLLVLVFVLSFSVSVKETKAITFDELVAQVTILKKEILSLRQSMKASVITASSTASLSKVLYKKGSTGKDVLNIQKNLQRLGYFSASTKVTEYYGPATARAVLAFQSDYGLNKTSTVDELTKSVIEGAVVTKEGSNTSSSKEGTGNRVAGFCLNRVSANINSTTKYLGFVLGLNNTDQFLYVMPGEKPSLFPYSITEDDLSSMDLYPQAPYVSGSLSSRLRFSDVFENYQDNYPDGSFNLVANPDTGINISLGKIFIISADGTKYNELGVTSFSELPLCTGPVRNFEGTLNFGTCTDGIQNGDELGIDWGGRCGSPALVQNTSFAHWPRMDNPVTIGIVNNASAAYSAPFDQSKNDWDASPVITLTQGNQIKVISGYYNEGWITATGVTTQTVLHSDGTYREHIIGSEVVLNDKYLTGGGQYDSDAWRLFAMCHGLGHAFGLNDRDQSKVNPNLGTCMDFTGDPSGINPQYGPLNNLHPSDAIDFPAILQAHHVNPGDGSNKPAGEVQSKTTTYTLSLQ